MRMLPFLFVCSVGLTAWSTLVAEDEPAALLEHPHALHIGIVVEDLESAISHWTALLGLDAAPPIIIGTGHEDNPTHYRGKPTDVQVRLAFFNLENIQIELLSPLGPDPNHWSEFLAKHGPGVHHLAFEVKGLGEVYLDRLKERGISLAQQGGWDGGEYTYADTHDTLGVALELLERYDRN